MNRSAAFRLRPLPAIASLIFIMAGFSLAEAAKNVKAGVDLTGMVSDTDGRYAYQADVDWSKYTVIVMRPFPVSAKKEYKGVTTAEGEKMLTRNLKLQCPLQKNEPREDQSLILDGRIAEFKPGSKGKRFWVGMGAGKGAVSVYAELKDPTTDEVILKYFNRTLDTGDITVRKNRRVIEVLMKRQAKHLCAMITRAKNGELRPTD